MRKLVSTLMTVTLMLVSVTACAERITPSKNYVTKKVNVGSFNAISTSSSVDVIYTQSSGGQDVEIYAPDNLVDYIDVRVEGGVLKVGFKSPRNNFSINGKHKPAGAVQGEESILFSNDLHFPQKNGAGGEFRGFLQRQAAGVYFLLWPGGHPGSHAVCRLGGCAPASV